MSKNTRGSGKPSKPEEVQLNARVSLSLAKRLGHYITENRGQTVKDTIAAALDEYLKKRGA